MKKIKVLIWEGLHFPENTMGVDLVIHIDPSDESGSLVVKILNTEITNELENIFYDEMLVAISEDEFDTMQTLEDLRNQLSQNFMVSFIDSNMTPQFINGGRLTSENAQSLN